MKIAIKDITKEYCSKAVSVSGWIRTVRNQKTLAFININDGSNLNGIQVVVEQENIKDYEKIISQLTVGSAVTISGEVVESPGTQQPVEIKATNIVIVGTCPVEEYPLQKKGHSFEFLRTIAHLRTRTNTFGAVSRVRNTLAYATHKFFQERGFYWINTPIITASDCEGAGQTFRVTTLNLEQLPLEEKTKKIDYAQDFFGCPTYLTVSGQLNIEACASALTNTYTFGPTFRAENSNTSRHLAEFWMIEPEIAFADLTDNMNLAESYLKYVLKSTLDTCQQDLEFFNQRIDKTLIERLEHIVKTPFERITYTKAIEILQKAPKKFEFPVMWGIDLQSEHERYLAEEYFKKPVILSDYPKDIKAFYMRVNDDNKTVAAMDILVAGIGELVGGSQREERLDKLTERLKQVGLNPEDYWWYLELRKFGSVPHAGFGVGFERLVQCATGMENIRDVIPFPRYPAHAQF